MVYIPSDASAIELPKHVLDEVREMDDKFGGPSLEWQSYHLSGAVSDPQTSVQPLGGGWQESFLPQGYGSQIVLNKTDPLVVEPGDVQALKETAPAIVAANARRPAPEMPKPPRIERWLVTAHAYKDEVASKMDFGLFSLGADVVQAGVIHEAKRYTRRIVQGGTVIEYGVAARLSAATTTAGITGGLTLSKLTAHAQLNASDTRIGISVHGYNGPLGDMLPAPAQLNMESAAEYLAAFRSIQAKVFGDDGWGHIAPTFLGYSTAPVDPA